MKKNHRMSQKNAAGTAQTRLLLFFVFLLFAHRIAEMGR
jgi:hypothetical protein